MKVPNMNRKRIYQMKMSTWKKIQAILTNSDYHDQEEMRQMCESPMKERFKNAPQSLISSYQSHKQI